MAKPTHSMPGGADPRHDPIDFPDDDEVIVPGIILGGKYRLISEIGRGGMGSVWRAEHLGWEAPVALKLMNRDITARPEAVARFEREVRLAAGLRSPHVVQVLDHGLDEATHTPFIAMELLEGESLARRLRRLGALSPGETFDIFSQLVRALTRAHAAGIVHRDLKPDNVFLVRNEEEQLTKVLDFGVAKWTAPDISESGLTRPGSVVGTPYYMSPEQIQGSREIDHRADLWALAAIVCECLTGRRPFEAPDFAQLAVLLLGNQGRPLPSELGHVPPGFDAWFLRATDPDIARRFQTAREMVQTLAPICDVAPSSLGNDYPVSPLTATRHDAPSMAAVSNTATRLPLTTAVWQRPVGKLVAATVAATLAVTGAVVFWMSRRPAIDTGPTAITAAQPLTPVAPSPPPARDTAGPNPGIRPIRAAEGDERAGSRASGDPPGSAQLGSSKLGRDLDGRDLDGRDVDGAEPGKPRSDRPSLGDEALAREEAARQVRAQLLGRPRRATKPKRAKPAPVASRAASKPSRSTNDGSAAPPPRATQPTPRPASEPEPSVVGGRRIRTSL